MIKIIFTLLLVFIVSVSVHAGDPKVTLFNKTETSSDVTLTGTVYHLIQALIPFLEKDFEITKSEHKLSVKGTLGQFSEYPVNGKITISIKYAGKILSNNAHSFDKEKNLMTWGIGVKRSYPI